MKHRAPMALAALAFAGGIWFADYVQPPAALWGVAAAMLVLCAVVAVFQASTRLAYLSSVLALLCAGACARVTAPVPRLVLPPPDFLTGDPVEIEGHVTSDGALLPGNAPRERFDLQTEIMRLGDRTFAQPVGIRAVVHSLDAEADPAEAAAEFPPLAYGDRVHLTARLRLPRNFRNPGAFDYEGYLRGLGISVLASVRSDDIESRPGKSGHWLGFQRSRIRRSILAHISSANSGLWGRDDAALFAAMIVGEDSLLIRDVREEFQETGVYHLLVVSGMNVALLAFAVFWLARRLRAPEWMAALVTIALSVFYAYIAGMGVPIQRAVLMLSVYLAARLLYRERAALNATGFAALVVLVVTPSALYDAGFQLTFLAFLAISGIGLPLLERTSLPLRRALRHFSSTSYDLALDPRLAQFRLDVRLVAERMGALIGAAPARWVALGGVSVVLALYELLVVSSITQAVLVHARLFPSRRHHWPAGEHPGAATCGNHAQFGSRGDSPQLRLMAVGTSGGMDRRGGSALDASLSDLACTPSYQWRVPDPGWMISLVAVSGIVFAFFAVRRRRGAASIGLALLFVSAATVAFYFPGPTVQPGKLEITAIDVGQGDSLLVISPQGLVMLVDGGGTIGPVRGEFDFGERVRLHSCSTAKKSSHTLCWLSVRGANGN